MAWEDRGPMPEPAHPFDDVSLERLRRRRTAKWSRYGPDVLPMWVAEMDFAVAPAVRRAIVDAVDREEFGYPVADEESGLPRAVADWELARHGWRIDPGRVHLLPDVLKGVEVAIERFSPEGSAVILPTPAYMPFFEVPTIVHRPIIEVPTLVDGGTRRLDYAGIDAAFRRGGGTVVLCQPYNPLGRSFSVEEMEQLAEVVDRHGGRVISDEVHAPLTYPQGRHVPYASISARTAGHAVTVLSASKGWNLPGLKCAQLITSNDVDEERWRSMPPLKTYGASTIGIQANLAAYRDGGSWLEELVAYLDGSRRYLAELLAEHLPAVGYTPPEATYLAWLDFRSLDLGTEPADFFLEHAGVATNPGPAFGGDGAGHVRFNFATSREILRRAVLAMAAAVAGRGGHR